MQSENEIFPGKQFWKSKYEGYYICFVSVNVYVHIHMYICICKCHFRTFSRVLFLLNYEIFIQNNICNVFSALLR